MKPPGAEGDLKIVRLEHSTTGTENIKDTTRTFIPVTLNQRNTAKTFYRVFACATICCSIIQHASQKLVTV